MARPSNELIGILAVGVGLAGLMLAGQSRLDARMDRLELRMEQRMDALEQRMDALEQRMDALEQRMARLEGLLHGAGVLPMGKAK